MGVLSSREDYNASSQSKSDRRPGTYFIASGPTRLPAVESDSGKRGEEIGGQKNTKDLGVRLLDSRVKRICVLGKGARFHISSCPSSWTQLMNNKLEMVIWSV